MQILPLPPFPGSAYIQFNMELTAPSPALLTDLYELTMAASYFDHGVTTPATFSLFIRNYPPNRSYFVSAGLEGVIRFLEGYRFAPEEIEYLRTSGLFSAPFLDYLGTVRFTGDLFAMQEGRVFFRDEPILELTAPVIEAQLMESFIINAVNLEVTLATKAARCVVAAEGRKMVDFSLRRTQGADAALKAARASFIAGFLGTSNVLAGNLYDIPIFGTMAHSYILSFPDELEAFRAFAATFPSNTVLLIDTYDTVRGAEKAAIVGREMKARGERMSGVRLDSGDIAELSKKVRHILVENGLDDAMIFASGGLDEFEIARILERGGEIDAFGVGTKMGVSADAPYTDMAYKLVNYGGRPVLKLSADKETLVCEKQVFRGRKKGLLTGDTITVRNERRDGEPLLKPVMKSGRRLADPEPLHVIQARLSKEMAALGKEFKVLEAPPSFPVRVAERLARLQADTIYRVKARELGES